MSTLTSAYPGLDSALLQFGARLDQVRQELYYCDVNFTKKESRFLRQSIRANGYVHLAAALEQLVNLTAETVILEINRVGISLVDLRLSLFSISSGGHFESLGDVRGLKNWLRRCEILQNLHSTDVVQLEPAHVPLDGRTIRPEHLNAIWGVFGFPGLPLPGPLHALALRDLADSRNDVAHANEDLSVVAGRKSVSDMFAFVARIEEVGLHLFAAADEYLQLAMFRR